MAAVTVLNDFGAQENKVCHCFHCFPIYLPWSDGTGWHDPSFRVVTNKKKIGTKDRKKSKHDITENHQNTKKCSKRGRK